MHLWADEQEVHQGGEAGSPRRTGCQGGRRRDGGQEGGLLGWGAETLDGRGHHLVRACQVHGTLPACMSVGLWFPEVARDEVTTEGQPWWREAWRREGDAWGTATQQVGGVSWGGGSGRELNEREGAG